MLYITGGYVYKWQNYINGSDYYKNSSCGFFFGEEGKYNLYGVHRIFH